MIIRCPWCESSPLYVDYHDKEWGMPVYESQQLWEKLVLDGFQAGLSWLTILRKREAFQAAFYDFNPERVARMTDDDVERLMQDKAIVRNRAKITGTIKGARIWLSMENKKAGAFSEMIWDAVDGTPVKNAWTSMDQVPTQTPQSVALSKALKKQGFTFCGPVIVYAFMQAVGLVNDHLVQCHRYEKLTP